MTGLRDIEVIVNDTALPEGPDGEPGTYHLYDADGDQGIKYYFPEPIDGPQVQSVTVRYLVEGGLRYYEDGDQLFWKAVYKDRPATVQDSRVTVTLPEGIAPDALVTASYDTASEITISPDGRTVALEATEPVPPGNEVEIRVRFPHGIVAGSAPPWQSRADLVDPGPARPPLSLILLIGGLVGLFLLLYRWGRDSGVSMNLDHLSEPPHDLPPGVAGTLVDEGVGTKHVMAVLLTLARKGAVQIEETRAAESGLLFSREAEYRFELLDERLASTPSEKVLIRELFRDRTERSSKDLKNEFYTSLPVIQITLYEEVIQAGYFHDHPETVRRHDLIAQGLVCGAVWIVLVVFAGLWLYETVAVAKAIRILAIVFFPLTLGFLGIMFLTASQIVPRKTKSGTEAAEQWLAFRQYLRQIDRYTDLAEKQAIWDEYLPYAVAFGVEKTYIEKFAKVDAPVPPWYSPYGWHHRHGYARSHDGGMVTVASEPTDPFPGDGSSDGGSVGLQSVSQSLLTMLNDTATTIASNPPSIGGGGSFRGGGGGFG